MDESHPAATLGGCFPTKLRQADAVLWGRTMPELALIALAAFLAFPIHDAVRGWPHPLPTVVLALVAASGPLLVLARPQGRRLDHWLDALAHYLAVRGAYVWRRRPQPPAPPPATGGWASRRPSLAWAIAEEDSR